MYAALLPCRPLTLCSSTPAAQEYRVMLRSIQGNDADEGIRAVLVTKGNNPKWRPATLEEVTDELVESHFASLGDHELVI